MVINKGIVNVVGFSLKELANCDEPFEYRMVFTSENSKDVELTLIKTPISSSDRLDVFEIDEPNEIDFPLEGYYHYNIYQTTSDNLVETGILKVEGADEQAATVNTSKTKRVYVRQNS